MIRIMTLSVVMTLWMGGLFSNSLYGGGHCKHVTDFGEVPQTIFNPLNCDSNHPDRKCPTLHIPKPNIKLEPSGLVWNPIGKYWVGVSDNFNDLYSDTDGSCLHDYCRYVVFGFKVPTGKTQRVNVFPLLSKADAEKYRPNDLEGITRNPDGSYTAIGSLSLHKKKPHRDTWYRFRGLKFMIDDDDEDNPIATNIQQLSQHYRADLREWVISSADIEWELKNITGRPEIGSGINVEGLASTSDGNLLIGFRGPSWHDAGGQSGTSAMVLESSALPPDKPPESRAKHYVAMEPVNGIRGFERVEVEIGQTIHDLFVMVTGREDGEHEQLSFHILDDQYAVLDSNKLPSTFVAEGVGVRSKSTDHRSTTLTVGIVDDVCHQYMEKKVLCDFDNTKPKCQIAQ